MCSRVAWCRQVQTLSYHPISQRTERLVCCLSAGNRTFGSCSVVLPPVPKPSLIFKILGLLHFLNLQTLTFFQSFWLMSFPSSALSLLLLLLQFSPSWTRIPKSILHFFACQKNNYFSLHISHFYNFVLTQPIFSLPIMYKTSSHCPCECYVTLNFSCPFHFSFHVFLRLCYREDVT